MFYNPGSFITSVAFIPLTQLQAKKRASDEFAGPSNPEDKKPRSDAGSERSEAYRAKTVATDADLVRKALVDCGRQRASRVGELADQAAKANSFKKRHHESR